MKGSLLWKLLAINVPVIGLVVVVVWLTIDYLAADYFTVLMERYNISPAETHQMFLDAIHRYLIQASLVALVLAVLLSFLFLRRILRPLSQMTEVTRRVGAGDFTARVSVASKDEVGQLGQAFNHMGDNLERVERLRKTMVADMAHELRTPLTNMRGYLEALKDDVVPPSPQTFAMLHGEILRLVRLVEDLNQLTKADAARTSLQRREIQLPDMVQQVIDLYAPEIRTRDLRVEMTCDPEVPRVMGDPDKLFQVLRNLVHNALRYSPEGGAVTVLCETRAPGVVVTLTNDGEGISPDDLPLVFERFYRADKSRSRDSGGAGIGLAIVKELVEAHGGQVGASSVPGDTRFWFSLPA